MDEISAIETLLNLHVGYGFEFFGGLISLREQEDLNEVFVVEWGTTPPDFEIEGTVSFKNAHEAAEFFVNKRNELEIGFEFEKEQNQDPSSIEIDEDGLQLMLDAEAEYAKKLEARLEEDHDAWKYGCDD